MESMTISKFDNDAVQEKKMDGYGWDKHDFLAGQELTVTITLGEYRDLVSKVATTEQTVRTINDRAMKAEADLKSAKETIERLKSENYDLQSELVASKTQRSADDTETESEVTE